MKSQDAEAARNVAQTYIDPCCGCLNFKRLRKRILYMDRRVRG